MRSVAPIGPVKGDSSHPTLRRSLQDTSCPSGMEHATLSSAAITSDAPFVGTGIKAIRHERR
jgi:hypothetical protein